MIIILIAVISLFGFGIDFAYGGAAVAMRNKQSAPKRPSAVSLPPGYVMTPQGIQKSPQSSFNEAVDVEVKDIVDLEDIIASLEQSSRSWDLIIDSQAKAEIVKHFILKYASDGIKIKKPQEFYAMLIDQMAQGSPEMLDLPFERVLQFVAVMEYDFGNGQNPDLLAQKILGQQFYEINRKRLMAVSQTGR